MPLVPWNNPLCVVPVYMYIMSCCTKECGEVNNVCAVNCSYCGVLIDQIIIIACISCGESFKK